MLARTMQKWQGIHFHSMSIFKIISLSLSMHLLPRMNVMLDFFWTLPVQLWGTWKKWTLPKNLIHSRICTLTWQGNQLRADRLNHTATTRLRFICKKTIFKLGRGKPWYKHTCITWYLVSISDNELMFDFSAICSDY